MLSIIFLQSCNWFSTREPEEPDTGRSTFIPPTSPDIVIANLKNAFLEKNLENYTASLGGSMDAEEFEFIPSAQANAIYEAIFSSWDLNSERQAFVSMVSSMESETYPSIVLSNSEIEVLVPHSAVYISDYVIQADHSVSSIPDKFAGTLQFTLRPADNGNWYINRWIDTKAGSDEAEDSWSVLKANFFNK